MYYKVCYMENIAINKYIKLEVAIASLHHFGH